MGKETTGKIYDLVEIAKSTGKVKKGANEVTKCIERSEAKIVVVAEDTQPPEILMHLEPLCKEREIMLVKVPNKKELGTSVGLDVPCSAIAILDAGEAKDILMELKKKE
jgi:large subunit ribosomal protein L7Ae